MATRGLTPLGIRNAKPRANRYILHDGNGLDVEVQPTSKKSWYLRYRRPGGGAPANLRLGAWLDDELARRAANGEKPPGPKIGDTLTLERARRLASRCRELINAGIDPGAQQQAAKRVAKEGAPAADRDLFEVIALQFLERYARPNTKASSFGETVSLLGFRLEKEAENDGERARIVLRRRDNERDPRRASTWPAIRWKGRKIQSITKRDMIELLDAIQDAGVPHAANSTQGALHRLFEWCVERDVLQVSPCAGVKKVVPTVKRERVLTDPELRLVWLAAAEMKWPFGYLVQLLALTGARRDEWAEAKWSEIDRKHGVFHLPAGRSKNGLAHDIPLVPQAVAVLDVISIHRLGGEPDWLFSTGTGRKAASAGAPLTPISGFSKAKLKLDSTILGIGRREAEAAGEDPESFKSIADWRLHDLRRTTVTGMARLGVAVEVAEKAVNHISGTFAGIVRVYQRHDFAVEVRDALKRWAAGVDRVVAGQELVPNNVRRLRRA